MLSLRSLVYSVRGQNALAEVLNILEILHRTVLLCKLFWEWVSSLFQKFLFQMFSFFSQLASICERVRMLTPAGLKRLDLLEEKHWSLDLNRIRKLVNFELSRWRKWNAFAFCRMCWYSGFPVPRSTKKANEQEKKKKKKIFFNFDYVFMVWLRTGLRPYNQRNTQPSCNYLGLHPPK